MQTDTTLSARINDLEKRFSFIEWYEGAFPYSPKVLNQEAVVQGSRGHIFARLLEWLGGEAFTEQETLTLIKDFWMIRPEFVLEALAQCPTAKGVVVDESYFYLLVAEGGKLRQELREVLKQILYQTQGVAVA